MQDLNEDYSLNLDPPSPTDLDNNYNFIPRTPSYGSYNNSPFSQNSELSFGDEQDDPAYWEQAIYNPTDHDNPGSGSLLVFDNTDYMPYDHYSSPSDDGGGNNQRSRASSVSSHQHLTPSPRMDVAHSFADMSFQSPAWGTEPLPPMDSPHRHSIHHRASSPNPQKPQSPPRLLMPDEPVYPSDVSSGQFNPPPTINAPDGDGDGASGPKLRIVPATPVSGGGIGGGGEAMPFRSQGGPSLGVIDEPMGSPMGGSMGGSYQTQSQSSQPQPSSSQQSGQAQSQSQASSSNFTFPPRSPQASSSSNPSSGFLFPNHGGTRSRSKSESSGPAVWDTPPSSLMYNDDSALVIDDGQGSSQGTVSMNDVAPQSQSQGQGNRFLTPEAGGPLRRSKSDTMHRPGHTRQSRSEDIRGTSPSSLLTVPGQGQYNFGNNQGYNGGGLGVQTQMFNDGGVGAPQFLSPQEPPVNIGNIRGLSHQQHQQHQQSHLGHQGHSQSFGGTSGVGAGMFSAPNLGMSSLHSSPNLGTVGLPGHHSPQMSQHQLPPHNHHPSLTHNPQQQGHFRRASSGTRSERGASSWDASVPQYATHRASPYPSPNASPRPRYDELPTDDMYPPASNSHPSLPQPSQHRRSPSTGSIHAQGPGGGGMPGMQQGVGIQSVSKPHVTTQKTSQASHVRRKNEAGFVCPVVGCGSTFTRSFNLKGHIRSHNEEKPFLCHWPGCGKGFARQHDCKRHEQLHTNYRPFTCEGCQKPFARMDALNRHLKSEGGAECQRQLELNGSSQAQSSQSQSQQPPPPSSSVSPPTSSASNRRPSQSQLPVPLVGFTPNNPSNSNSNPNNLGGLSLEQMHGLEQMTGLEQLEDMGMGDWGGKTEDLWAGMGQGGMGQGVGVTL